MRIAIPALAVLAVAACATHRALQDVPAPLLRTVSGYEAAATVDLPEIKPLESPVLHNVYRLSKDIVSGAEPEGEEAMKALADLGIRTVLSVDGKAPDAASAAAHGMRYVHVPIRYHGMTSDEMLAISKTFRELEGPFYVHCHHGEHRGPAAAAIGRLVRDGASREQALAEMRQWCGTSPKYPGLYDAIAFGDLPDGEETEDFDFDFPAVRRFAGFRQAMVEVSRAWETVENLSRLDFGQDPSHPDASARNEAEKLAEVFAQCRDLDEVRERPEDFLGWIGQSEEDARQVALLLVRLEGGDAGALEPAREAVARVRQSCAACHGRYRN
ncbi:MAG: hypothetical protein HY812_14870 [Planctomycetes bacterium]|nr:hypothetical protein [Planctomycetota bacterium]